MNHDSTRALIRGAQVAEIALIKYTRVREQLDLEFSTEVFNLTNTPAFGTSAFGTITSTASDARVIQFGLKLNY